MVMWSDTVWNKVWCQLRVYKGSRAGLHDIRNSKAFNAHRVLFLLVNIMLNRSRKLPCDEIYGTQLYNLILQKCKEGMWFTYSVLFNLWTYTWQWQYGPLKDFLLNIQRWLLTEILSHSYFTSLLEKKLYKKIMVSPVE